MKQIIMTALFVIAVTICLNSCSKNTGSVLYSDTDGKTQTTTAEVTEITTVPQSTEEKTAASSAESLPPEDQDTVSPLAVRDFLPCEDYSWEREYPVEFVMIHFSSNVVIDIEDPYSLSGIRSIFETNYVSANYVIDRDGSIYCWIPENRAAWHAGKGVWNGDEKYENKMNKYSIGIELMAIGSKSDMSQYLTSKQYDSLPKELIGYTDRQYEALAALLTDITQRWDITPDRSHIIGHEEYSSSKSDPGELFDWNRIISLLSE